MRRAVYLAAALLALVALVAPAAWAGGFDSVFADYTKDGHIDPCRHSAADLRRARDDIPPDIEQYAPDFPEALDAALEARAGGRCDKKAPKPAAAAAPAPAPAAPAPPASGGGSGGGAASPAAPAPTPAAAAAPPAPAASSAPAGAPTDNAIARAARGGARADADPPAPLIALGVLGALAALAGLAYGLARWRAWEPAWALRARHAAGEASFRASATWAEFADWLRLGQR